MGDETFSPIGIDGATRGLKSMDFPTAIKEVLVGKKIQKLEWGKGFYGFLAGGFLKLQTPDGKNYSWTLSKADLMGDDYLVV